MAKGRITTYTADEAPNVSLGQLGSACLTAAADNITPPSGCAIIAIQIVQHNTKIDVLEAEDATRWPNTVSAAHDYASEDENHGTGGDTFPTTSIMYPGFTMFGRWTSVSVSQGALICYFGK